MKELPEELNKQSEVAPISQATCPDCGFKNMNIYDGGRIHCGKCLNGGHITAKKYDYLKSKESKE